MLDENATPPAGMRLVFSMYITTRNGRRIRRSDGRPFAFYVSDDRKSEK